MQPKNGETSQLERMQKVAQLYCQGKSQLEIAREVKVSQDTVSRDLVRIRDLWIAHSLVDFGEARAKELAKVDHLEKVAWEAWSRSCEDAVVKRRRVEKAPQVVPVEGQQKKVTVMRAVRDVEDVETSGRDGDPKFLDVVFKCVEMRLKLLGLLKDVTINNTQVNAKFDLVTVLNEVAKDQVTDPVEDAINRASIMPEPIQPRLMDEQQGLPSSISLEPSNGDGPGQTP